MAAVSHLDQAVFQGSAPAISRRWGVPPAVVITVMALVTIAASIGVVLSVDAVFSPPDPGDPFTIYDAIMPGQPVNSLGQYGCNSVYLIPDMDYPGEFYCQIDRDDETFLSISVGSDDQMIRSLSFSVDGLLAGDLVQRWGRPDRIRSFGHYHILAWQEGIYATGYSNGHFSYMSEVRYVFVTLPYDSRVT